MEVQDLRAALFVFDFIGGDPDLRDLLDPPYMKTLPHFPCGERRGGAAACLTHALSFPVSPLG